LREGGSAGGAALQNRVEAAGSTLAAAVTNAADRLTEAGNSASGALERGGDQAAGHLSGAGEAFAAQTDELARHSLALAASAREIGNRFAELDRATRSVIEPLLSASSDLRAAGVSAQNAASPLVKSAEASAQVLSQVSATAQRLEAVGQQAGNLIASLNAAAQRFEGVDKELAGTIRTLQEGLQGFTTQISTFVGKTDSNMTQATQNLANLVKELQATIEDFTDAQPPRKG
jgi:chromosome segregation ATPase